MASPARIWNYWLDGKDNFASDREASEKVLAAMTSLPQIARATRRFLIDAMGLLTAEHGIRQFLDIGTGLPTADNTHEVAQRLAPDSRIVCVDYDPVLLAHARALLTSSPEGETDYIQVPRADNRSSGSFRRSADLLSGIRRIIDRAVQGNMFSVLTDCPHREKLGWLERDHLLFGVVSRGYDVAARSRRT